MFAQIERNWLTKLYQKDSLGTEQNRVNYIMWLLSSVPDGFDVVVRQSLGPRANSNPKFLMPFKTHLYANCPGPFLYRTSSSTEGALFQVSQNLKDAYLSWQPLLQLELESQRINPNQVLKDIDTVARWGFLDLYRDENRLQAPVAPPVTNPRWLRPGI